MFAHLLRLQAFIVCGKKIEILRGYVINDTYKENLTEEKDL